MKYLAGLASAIGALFVAATTVSVKAQTPTVVNFGRVAGVPPTVCVYDQAVPALCNTFMTVDNVTHGVGLSATLPSTITGIPFNPSVAVPSTFSAPNRAGIKLVAGVPVYIAGSPTSLAQDTPAGTLYVSKETNYTGIIASGTPPAIYGFNIVRPGAQGPQAGVLGTAHNENTLTSQPAGTSGVIGIYGIGTCGITACTATWGGVTAGYDTTNQSNPTNALYGLEVDNYAHGTDNNNVRIGIQIVADTPDGAGTLNTVGSGLLFTGSGAASKGKFTNLINGGTSSAVNGVVLANMTITNVAFNSPGFQVNQVGDILGRDLSGRNLSLTGFANTAVAQAFSWGANNGTAGGQIIMTGGTGGTFYDNYEGGDSVFRTTSFAETIRLKTTGIIQIKGASGIVANGTVATNMSSLGPVGSNTTIQEWLVVKNSAGTNRYIPLF